MWGFHLFPCLTTGRFFNRERLHSLAVGYNRAEYRREVLLAYRALQREVEYHARHGEYSVISISAQLITERATFHAYRLFARKHSDFAVSWCVWRFSDLQSEVKMAYCPYSSSIARAQLILKW